MKRFLAIIISTAIVFIWVITLVGGGKTFPSIKDQIKLGLDISGGINVVLEADTKKTGDDLKTIMDQTKAIIEMRVNELGLSEPIITIEGEKRIRVEIPGAKDSDDAVNQIGKTAKISFHSADGQLFVDGKDIKDAAVETDNENGGFLVSLKFTSNGGKGFAKATKKASDNAEAGDREGDDEVIPENIIETKNALLINLKNGRIVTNSGLYPVVKDEKYDLKKQLTKLSTQAIEVSSVAIILDGEIVSTPTAKQEIKGESAVITGSFSQQTAKNLAMLIRGGALPVKLVEVESSKVGASIGMNALVNSIIAGLIGILLIIILMVFFYRIFGAAASLSLLLYVPIVLWTITLLRGVLTLPGIAGIILSVGMAVDANVIIFSRIREEAFSGKSIALAASQGFKKAMAAIIDSQSTTLIAGVVLYLFGTGSVKGFALTLIIGIFVGVFSSLVITHFYVQFIVNNGILSNKRLVGFSPLSQDKPQRTLKFHFNFIKNRKIFYLISIVIIVVGIGVGLLRGFNFGIDFTGGTRIGVTIVDKKVKKPDTVIKNALKEAGVKSFDFTSQSSKDGKAFIAKTKMPLTEKNRNKILSIIKKTDKKARIDSFEQFGASIGELITQNAIKAILIAAFAMLLYIIIRFRFKFAISSILALTHDVLIMIAFYGIFNVTVNSPFIAAILTVVGYSINDTIVVFDRIRENAGILDRKKYGFDNLINTSINQTLGRSVMTSVTTLVAIVPLIILGGESIREFVMPLVVGILAGTASSIFIASSLFYDLSKNEGEEARYIGAQKEKVVGPDFTTRDDGAVV